MSEKKLHFPPHTDGLHIWVPTTSPLIERCGRGCCQAMRRWRKGAWVEAQLARSTPPTTKAHQPGLWA